MTDHYEMNPTLAGRYVECDGGSAVHGGPGGALGARDLFRGRLTGRYFQEGDPPWRWYEIGDLDAKPDGYIEGTVWCETGFMFFIDELPIPERL